MKEKSKEPKISHAIAGLNLYPTSVSVRYIKVGPSTRGELDIMRIDEMLLSH